ncbi:Ribonuclease H-like superfamily [Arabidopsis thaliana x Arabidopsis arenosa]|uniref:Ribonuclease H-like superfamily n=1 Tax=Arabidopsis thaliana x Arabidopsis arenosa TaxID=1240361 RepID=A0A8T2C6W9_9BRAS|nr:Ribonuclease H-like superfamily [Arabidopsis thaliana x Arabidopsis arenosa]
MEHQAHNHVMKALFKEYSSIYGTPSTQSSQSNASSSGTAQNSSIPSEFAEDHPLEFERMDNAYDEMVMENGVTDSKDELDIYLKDEVETPKAFAGTEWDVLSWWRLNRHKYPVLSEIAKDVLAMQVSSVASESAFSTSGRIIEPHRSCLTHYMVEVLMCTEQWLKQDIKITESITLTNAQIMADIEYLDNLEKEVQNAENQN